MLSTNIRSFHIIMFQIFHFQINVGPTLSRHYETCKKVQEWRNTSHKRFCTTSYLLKKALCNNDSLLLLQEDLESCRYHLKWLVDHITAFSSAEDYDELIKTYQKENAKDETRFKREGITSKFNGKLLWETVLEAANWAVSEILVMSCQKKVSNAMKSILGCHRRPKTTHNQRFSCISDSHCQG